MLLAFRPSTIRVYHKPRGTRAGRGVDTTAIWNSRMSKMMHLTGFMLFSPAPHTQLSWVYPKDKIRHQWHEIGYWEEIARTLERGRFDMFFFADGWAGGGEVGTRYAIQFPTHDPVILVSRLSTATEHLGFAVTMSTSFYPPYMTARKLPTLDHVTEGRIGWNIVNSLNSAEARNFGVDDLLPHDERYERADKYMEVCQALWDSGEPDAMVPDAMVMDMENKVFADPDKVHRIDHAGKYFDVMGPLNVVPGPQVRPVLFQAGASPRGREFAVRHAECIFGAGGGAKGMREFADDIAQRSAKAGRTPPKIIWGLQPIVAASEAEAKERQEEMVARIPIEAGLATMAGHFNLDLTKVDLDTPVSQLPQIDGTRGMLAMYTDANPDITFRQIAQSYLNLAAGGPAGTPEQVADAMQALFEDGGGHGFQLTPAYYAPDYYADIVDLLIPELQRRGLVRREYTGTTLRDHLSQDA